MIIAVGIGWLVIGVFGDAADDVFSGNRSRRTGVCHYGPSNTPYEPDTVIEIIPNDCHKVYCNREGVIEHLYPLGRSTENCCECYDKIYGRRSNTCEYVEINGRCQEGCEYDGNIFGNGELVQSVPQRCSKTRCLNGEIVEEAIFPGMNGCCLDDRNQMREYGCVNNDGCLQKICTNGIWLPNPDNINAECEMCRAFNDPHFTDFSGVIYDWHVGCNHALVQEDKADPKFGVFMDFDRPGSSWAGVGTTTYQEDMDTKVVLTIVGRQVQLAVNGRAQEVNSVIPTLLVGPNGETTVYAWRTSLSCVRLYGEAKILVELCGYVINIWAAPWSLGDTMLTGLCGSTKASALAEKKLVARNGDKYEAPARRYGDAHNSFGLSWQAEEQTKDTCPEVESRSNAASEDIRKSCLDDTNNSNNTACLIMVDNAGLTGDDRYHSLYTCTFDLCIAVNDPETPFTKEEMLEQHRVIAAVTKSNADSTIEFASGIVNCPYGWSPVGGQCYQINNFDASLSLEDAQNNCKADDASLAHPLDVTQFNRFIRGSYWLGAIHVEDDMEWIVGGGQIPKNQFLIGVPRYDPNKPNNCLEIQLPTTDSNKLPQVIVKQNVEINAKKVKSIKIESKVYYYNGKNELVRVEGTNTIMECIQPQVYVCEREPLECGDEDDNCAWRAADGECNASKTYMYNTCKESCKVPCECDQPETCTAVGGICQPLGAICNDVSDPELCSNDDCTCCYFPDPCQDSGDEDCKEHKLDGLCASTDTDVLAELKKHCNRTCGFCDPLF